ncbi:putative disease resistance protein RGA3 [Cucurbita pepo subsp. pepo]|uniref:putative disease resistance protein RGA3 n=1 Tax=Cucurbita pepo subsp. pepo TaxID=3664 RepID=UPI000C9D9BE4|nr:putative disease resistance protein RGA3 [Cucurbita pepo subsp. pepo]
MTQLQTLSGFLVGCDDGCKIEELGHLKDLKGKFSLLHLEQIKSKTEAMAANLVDKEKISDLYFEWSFEREDCGENDLNVLEGLQPHKSLQALRIHNFGGELLPNGIFVENLVELTLYGCKRCETLPMIGQLPKLEVLEIRELNGIKSIGDEFYENYRERRTLFPKLKTFEILHMESLEEWEEVATISSCITFPHLESLAIRFCLKLTNIPDIFATYGQRLEVDTINAKFFSSFQSPPKLRSLHIHNCTSLIKLPNWLEFYSSLEDLWIGDFFYDIYPPNLQNMQNLSSLGIKNFPNLPEGLGGIHNLKTLVIKGPMLGYDWSRFIPFNLLEVLELHETGTNSLTQLPQQLELLTALRSLHIENFNDIESLPEWLGNITSLETLELCRCRNLKNLPSRKAMSNLTKLNRLRAYECSWLEVGEGTHVL